jgi:hypothetical protein
MGWILEGLGEVVTTGDGFSIDSLPAPVCRRACARRWRTVRGRACCGSCAAKRETFFGWRVHLVCRPDGVPVRVQMLPAGMHDLTPPPPRTRGGLGGGWPARRGAAVGRYSSKSAADEASILAETVGVQRRCARTGAPGDHASARLGYGRHEVRAYRHPIETVNRHLETMGIERLDARTNAGFELKVHATLIALICTNMN